MASNVAQKKEQQYFNKLLDKHQKTKQLSESFVRDAASNYEKMINKGTYIIKQGKPFTLSKNKDEPSRLELYNMKQLKRSLENSLQLIDSRVGELTEPENHKSKPINQDERRKFVRQMAKARRKIAKQREKQIMEMQQLKKKQQQQQLEQMKKREESEHKKKKQQLLKRSESLEVRKKERQSQIEQGNKKLKEKMHEKILSERILEQYRRSQSKNLEEHKKMLAEIRSLHKPLSKNEFEAHLQKYEQLKSSRQKEKLSTKRYATANTSKLYQSSWYKEIKSTPKQYEEDKHQEEIYRIKEMKDKLKKYAEYVQSNFKPEVSHKKSKTASDQNKSMPIQTKDLREIGLQYLQYSKQQIDQSKRQRDKEEDERENRRVKPINYLEQLKSKHGDKKSAREYVESIKHKKNMSDNEKAQKILDYIDGLERKAKLKEEKGKFNKDMVDEDLDGIYMEAIAMKLSLLGKQ